MAGWLRTEPPYHDWNTSPRSPRKPRADPVDHREVDVGTLGMNVLHKRDPRTVLKQLAVARSVVCVAAGGGWLVWTYQLELIGFDLDVVVDHR
jgi:hypothetical protein